MSIDNAVARGRRAHNSRMRDTFTIGLPDGWELGLDGSEVEKVVPLFTTVGYFPTGARTPKSAEGGGRTILSTETELRIPWDSPQVPANAIAVCTAVGTLTPSRMLGRRVRVDGSSGDGSQRTHYPLQVVEVLT